MCADKAISPLCLRRFFADIDRRPNFHLLVLLADRRKGRTVLARENVCFQYNEFEDHDYYNCEIFW